MRIFSFLCLFFCLTALSSAQDILYRGSIPEELLRPQKGEPPHFPVDMIIGELGQGSASNSAYSFAKSIAVGLISANMEHPALAGIKAELREEYLNALAEIIPRSYRLGGGREEPDGAVSFMIRLIGRESGVAGELFIRYVTRQIKSENEEDETKTTGSWKFEDLILESAISREEEQRESLQRFDFSPYERFF
ncbi:MAG: hypothetical protein LBV17_00450 [Treponema sp.]|jgi:hypothetical protein|nr:hypothetical protein [Treponema sp.]